MFDELTPPYGTIVADPPWAYDEGWPPYNDGKGDPRPRKPLGYSTMTVEEIAAMPVADLAADDAHLYLWTTNRYLEQTFGVLRAWGFTFGQVLTWCKPPQGIGPGGIFSTTTEFVLVGRRGSPGRPERVDSTWFEWPRGHHSVKPAAFGDMVEKVSRGPYVELFCRQPRFGWDSWGKGFE